MRSSSSRYTWRAVLAIALPFIYMGGIFYLSAQPGVALHIRASDKLLHALEYAGLSLVLYSSFAYGLGIPAGRASGLAIALSVLYGMSDELHQAFVPGRDPSVLDLVADAVGAIGAQMVVLFLRGVAWMWRMGRDGRR